MLLSLVLRLFRWRVGGDDWVVVRCRDTYSMYGRLGAAKVVNRSEIPVGVSVELALALIAFVKCQGERTLCLASRPANTRLCCSQIQARLLL